MKLEMLQYGNMEAERVFKGGMLTMAKVGGEWFGLNWRSCNPMAMRGCAERAMWAKAIGLPPRDVESWVRAEKRKTAADKRTRNVEAATLMLESYGYTVSKL